MLLIVIDPLTILSKPAMVLKIVVFPIPDGPNKQITSRHYFVRATANDFNATTNETFYTESVAGVKRIISGLQSDPKTFITSVGLYNSDNELLAIAKLSKPIIKSRSREALIKVKLDF